MVLYTKVARKGLGRRNKCLQNNIVDCPLKFQPQTDEALTVDGCKHTHRERQRQRQREKERERKTERDRERRRDRER